MRHDIKNRFIAASVMLVSAVTACSPSEPTPDPAASSSGAESPTVQAQPTSPLVLIDTLTGDEATTDTFRTWQIGATDLGIMWDDGNGGVLTAFGDTFSQPKAGGSGSGLWRSNVLLRSTDRELSDGMKFSDAVVNESDFAIEIFPGEHKFDGTEVTKIPTGGIQVDGVQYVAHMSVKEWGDPGKWATNHSQIAYSKDGGKTWQTDGAPRWENDATGSDGFQMVSFVHHDGQVYMFGTPNGRFGDLRVARVPETEMLDKAAYRYWDGADWVPEEANAAVIVEAPVSETSTRFDEATGLWQLIHVDSEAGLVLRTSSSPTGPWSEKQVLGLKADHPGIYGGFIHPWSPDGALYLAVSIWDEYNVSLMRVELDEDGKIVRPNLLVDPSFERSTEFDVDGGWRADGSAGIDTVSSWAKQGRQQFRVRDDQGEHWVHQPVTVQPKTAYRLSGWLNQGDDVGGGAGEGKIGVRTTGGEEIASESFGDLEGWTHFEIDFETGDATTVDVFAGSTMTAERWVQGDAFALVERGSAVDG